MTAAASFESVTMQFRGHTALTDVTTEVQADTIKSVGGSGRVVQVREEYMPVVSLEEVFNVPRSNDARNNGVMVVVEAEGRRAALMVDELLGQQQVVVKNLESNYRKVTGISGATILGDGGVSLILDVSALMRSSRQLADDAIFS